MTLQASFQLPGAEAESLSFEVLRVTQEWTKEVSFAWVLKLTDQLLNDRPFEARERSAGLGFRSPHEIELDAFDPRRPKPGSPTRVLPSPATEPSSARSEEGLEGLIESYEGSRAVARVRIGGAAIPVAFPAAVFIAKGLHPGDRFFWHPRPDGNVLPADIEALSVFSPDEKTQEHYAALEAKLQKLQASPGQAEG